MRTGPFEGYVWSIGGRGDGWTLLYGYGPGYAACTIAAGMDARTACPVSPVILETDGGRFELPPGTWGEYVPPLGFAGL